MGYTNSPLVVYTKLSPNHSGQRTHSIDRITPHCVVGQLSAESICGCFTSTSRQAKADAKAAEEAKKAEAESVVKKLLASGMSADEILEKLK